MGCCSSRPERPNSPYLGGAAPSGSDRAINAPAQAPSLAEEATAGLHSGSSHHRHRRHSQPLEQHINKPLRLVPWTSRNRTWTRTLLDREREAFFDTRVTGRQEVWQTVRAALEVLQSPADDDATLQENIATAQSILDAAEITLPSGNLVNGVYDALGNYYALPEYVVSDPTNVVDDDATEHPHDSKQPASVNDASDDDEDEDEDEELERRREEKGKAVVDVREQISVRARLSENAQDIRVSVAKKDTVKVLARKVLVESGLPSSKRIRIAYMGKILKENISLLDQGYEQGHIVNALVFDR